MYNMLENMYLLKISHQIEKGVSFAKKVLRTRKRSSVMFENILDKRKTSNLLEPTTFVSDNSHKFLLFIGMNYKTYFYIHVCSV